MNTLSGILAACLFIACVTFAALRGRRSGQMALLDWSIVSIGLVYGLGWVLVLTLTISGKNELWGSSLQNMDEYYLVHNLMAIILAVSVIAGWNVSSVVGRKLESTSARIFKIGRENLHLYAWILLAIAILLRWVYVRAYGGFVPYLDYSLAIRSGIYPVENPFSYLQPFGGMGVFASFLFFAAILDGKRGFIKLLGFAISVMFAIYVLYSLLGRVGFLIYVATFFLALLHFKGARPSVTVSVGLLGSALGLALAYALSQFLGIKGADSAAEYVAGEISFPFVSFYLQLDFGEHLYRWFRDFAFAPLYLLPSSVWSTLVEDVSQINTLVVLGAEKGSFGNTGGIPVDLMTLGLMQCSLPGIAIVGVMFGFLIRCLQEAVDGIQIKGLRSVLWAYAAIRVAFFAVPYAQPVHLISGTFGELFCVAMLAGLSIVGRLRWR